MNKRELAHFYSEVTVGRLGLNVRNEAQMLSC